MTSSHFAKDNTSHPLMASGAPQGPPGGGGQPRAAGGPGMGGGRQQMGGGPMGQRQQGQAVPTLAEKLAKFALPSEPVAEKDMAGIKDVIGSVCAEISASIKSAGQKVDNEVLKQGILGLQDWLKKQGCIEKASTRYDVESTDKYASQIFFTYPGTLPFDIDFKMAGNVKKPYRLLLYVTKIDLFTLASLVENKSLAGVPVPKGWPKNSWSYWTDRP